MQKFVGWGQFVLTLGLVVVPRVALAITGGTGMPWDQPLTNVSSNVIGFLAPVAVSLGVVGVGLATAYASHGVVGKAGSLVLGGSTAVAAPATMSALGWAGAIF